MLTFLILLPCYYGYVFLSWRDLHAFSFKVKVKSVYEPSGPSCWRLTSASVAWSDLEYFYSPQYGMLVHCWVTPQGRSPLLIYRCWRTLFIFYFYLMYFFHWQLELSIYLQGSGTCSSTDCCLGEAWWVLLMYLDVNIWLFFTVHLFIRKILVA